MLLFSQGHCKYHPYSTKMTTDHCNKSPRINELTLRPLFADNVRRFINSSFVSKQRVAIDDGAYCMTVRLVEPWSYTRKCQLDGQFKRHVLIRDNCIMHQSVKQKLKNVQELNLACLSSMYITINPLAPSDSTPWRIN